MQRNAALPSQTFAGWSEASAAGATSSSLAAAAAFRLAGFRFCCRPAEAAAVLAEARLFWVSPPSAQGFQQLTVSMGSSCTPSR